MKTILSVLCALGVAAGSAYAGCGKIVEDSGKLSSYDSDTKEIVVQVADDKQANLTITPDTKNADKIESWIGKNVVVLSEHKKVTEVKLAES